MNEVNNLQQRLSANLANKQFETIAKAAVALNDFDATHYQWMSQDLSIQSDLSNLQSEFISMQTCPELYYKGKPLRFELILNGKGVAHQDPNATKFISVKESVGPQDCDYHIVVLKPQKDENPNIYTLAIDIFNDLHKELHPTIDDWGKYGNQVAYWQKEPIQNEIEFLGVCIGRINLETKK